MVILAGIPPTHLSQDPTLTATPFQNDPNGKLKRFPNLQFSDKINIKSQKMMCRKVS